MRDLESTQCVVVVWQEKNCIKLSAWLPAVKQHFKTGLSWKFGGKSLSENNGADAVVIFASRQEVTV